MLDLSAFDCLGEALLDAVQKGKNRLALIEANRDRENGRWTYKDIKREAERIGSSFQEKGFQEGNRCAILMSNQAKWLLSATGAMWVGAVIVPIDYKLTPAEQLALLHHSKPKVLIVEWPIFQRIIDQNPLLCENQITLVTEAPEKAMLGKAIRWETPTFQSFQWVPRKREDVACIVYSSGTGGIPKGCQLTHHNYLSQAQVLADLFPIGPKERYFSILPTNHAIDFMCGFLLPLFFSSVVVHQRTLRPEFIVATMKKYGVTHMAIVPLILKAFEKAVREKLNQLPRWKMMLIQSFIQINRFFTRKTPKYWVSSRMLKSIHQGFGGRLRLVFAGGAFVEASSAQFFYDLGIPVVIGYGLTEAGTVLTVNDLHPYRSDTVGKPLPGTELIVKNPNEVGVGEIWVKGPTVMKGYLNEPELTEQTIVDGWLRTGDLGFVDSLGHVKLVGRLKNMIVTEGGKNIYPEDLESNFHDIDGCAEQAVFASNYVWPGRDLTQEELLLVVRPKEDVSREKLENIIRNRNLALSDYKRLSRFVVWEKEFPRTASMKLKREVLADELRNHLDRTKDAKAL